MSSVTSTEIVLILDEALAIILNAKKLKWW